MSSGEATTCARVRRTQRHDIQRLAASLSPVRDSGAYVRWSFEGRPPGTVGRYNPFFVDIVLNVTGKPLREKYRISQAEFAVRFGFSVRMVQEWEQGRAARPTSTDSSQSHREIAEGG
ncbi:MAG TPA: hypothetical protein VKV28_12240 [Candidatus Binataceae bacterium]|nr:hypothetical protein [Candidatus Binataceae bacterium]